MLSDISNYIQDHIKINNLVIGLVSTSFFGFDASVDVKKFNPRAKFDCKLEERYFVYYENSQYTPNSRRNYLWIDLFPEVKSAIEHRNTCFEKINEVKLQLDVGIDLSDIFTAGFAAGQTSKFYVSYTAKGLYK